MVVEDEPIIRIDLIDALEEEGFQVVEAVNASEALHVLQANSDITGVVSDVNMPGSMDGIRMAQVIRGHSPQMVLILVSARALSLEMLPEETRFFSKPLDFPALLTTLNAVLPPS
jgi:DNA-binding NtrC family response regulator